MTRSTYLWKSDDGLNRVANVRYKHGAELSKIPGVTGIGIGKDHIIAYVSNEAAKVPETIEGVAVIKIFKA